MARRGKKATQEAKQAAGWAALTWDDLEEWAGSRSVSRGRSYQNQGRVKDLAVGADGRLLATVQGGDRYFVAVRLNGGKRRADKLESDCTCPVGCDCKHAVATVAAYLQSLTDGVAVPVAEPNDRRWRMLEENDEDLDDWDDDDWDGDEDEGDDLEDDVKEKPARKPPKRGAPRRTAAEWDGKIEQLVRGKNREELADELLALIGRYPELREEYRERIALSEGDVDRLTAQARHELVELTAETGWRNHWNGEGHTPDYTRLKHRLERLVELDHCDAVVKLGREFITRGMAQIDQSHDEGETAMAVAECFPVIFDAVAKSSLAASDKILFAIDACLQDGCDALDQSPGLILDKKWKPADWSAVAEELNRRLKKASAGGTEDAWECNYRRDQISGWLLTALKNAGREGEMLAICESEARATGSYERLVKRLLAAKRFEDAERWACEGIEKTREKWPGIASSLAELLCGVARGRRQWAVVAAHAAVAFFGRPSARSLDELVKAAAKAKCDDRVRATAMRFLETGASPFTWAATPKAGQQLRVDPDWPLPVPGYLLPVMRPRGRFDAAQEPHYHVLLDMAIAAKNPEEALRWYDKMPKEHGGYRGRRGWVGGGTDTRVAAAVAQSHPQRALEIYRRSLDGVLPQADFSAYEAAAEYLKKMQPIMESLGRKAEWAALLAEIRQKYRNRPRFMEKLDKLDGRTILETQKARKR